ncbi:hypothetical protein ELS17_12720 [Natrinema altunense]|uniref:Uncharacterized protein n=1 Tax=Natrinema altunense TaxID=222984 RepID=A0A482XYZ7_9EURY|nr:hypothetical protein ELS17_12720 [Natrinema altunense]
MRPSSGDLSVAAGPVDGRRRIRSRDSNRRRSLAIPAVVDGRSDAVDPRPSVSPDSVAAVPTRARLESAAPTRSRSRRGDASACSAVDPGRTAIVGGRAGRGSDRELDPSDTLAAAVSVRTERGVV